MAGGGGYGALLRTPGAKSFSGAALVGRLPIAMLGIGSVLLVEDRRGSYALAGAVAAAYALGIAALNPFVARQVDARGQRRVLPLTLVGHAIGLVALLLLVGTDAPGPLLLLPAAVAGGFLPPLGSCVRTRWGVLLTAQGRELEAPTAFALESVVDEVLFVLGPLLIVLAALVDPAIGLVLALALGTTGTLLLAAQHATEPPAHALHENRQGSVLRRPGVAVLATTMAFVGVVFGSVEVGMVAFAGDRGSEGAAGPLLALVALGSAAAGLAYGARSWRTPLARRYVLSLLGLAVGVLPLLLAPSLLWVAPAGLVAGIAISPSLIGSFSLVNTLVPVQARTEGFTVLNSGLGVGVALGSALTGAVADATGGRVGLAVGAVGAVLALSVAQTGRRRFGG